MLRSWYSCVGRDWKSKMIDIIISRRIIPKIISSLTWSSNPSVYLRLSNKIFYFQKVSWIHAGLPQISESKVPSLMARTAAADDASCACYLITSPCCFHAYQNKLIILYSLHTVLLTCEQFVTWMRSLKSCTAYSGRWPKSEENTRERKGWASRVISHCLQSINPAVSHDRID